MDDSPFVDPFNPFGSAPKTPEPTKLESFGAGVSDFLRPVTRALEPLALLQDVAFGIWAGDMDPNTTISERLGKNGNFMQTLKAYLPYGDTPQRPATGQEIAEFIGVPKGRGASIVGFGLDLFADPLMAGSYVRAIGKVSGASDLVRWGNRIETALSPGFYLKGISAPISGYVGRRMDLAAQTLRSAQGTILGVPSSSVANLLDSVLPKEMGLQAKFGEDVGSQLRRVRQRNEQSASNIFDEIAIEAQGIERDMFGLREQGLWRRIGRVLSGDIRNMDTMVSDVRAGTRLVMEKELTSLVDSRGVLFLDQATDVADNLATPLTDVLNPIRGEVRLGGASATPKTLTLGFESRTANPIGVEEFATVTPAARAQADTLYQEAVQRIRDTAVTDGYNPTEIADLIQRFDTGYKRSVIATTRLGLELSGYPLVKEAFYETITGAGGTLADAQNIYTDVLRRVIGGESVDSITDYRGTPLSQMFNQALLPTRDGPRRMAERARTPALELRGVQNVLASNQPTPLFPGLNANTASPRDVEVFNEAISVGDLLGTARMNTSLQIDEFIRSLPNGHLRRSLAMFSDPKSYESYVRSLESGRFMLSNVVDSLNVRSIPGIDPDAGREVETFLQQIEGAGNIRAANFSRTELVTTVAERLTRGGMNPRQAFARANDAAALIAREANGSPALRQMIDWVRDFQNTYNGQTSGPLIQGATDLSGGAFLDPRSLFTPQVLNALGRQTSIAYPLIETAKFASKTVPKANYIREISTIGRRYGYVADAGVTTGRNGARYTELPANPEIYGELAGQAVHPYLATEINRMLGVNQWQMPNWFNNLKGIITGGYLARPSVGFANLIGGIHTTTMLGVNPLSIIRSMARTYRPLNDFFEGRGTPDIIEQLSHRIDLVGTSLIASDIERWSDNAMKAKYNLSGEGVTEALGGLNNTIISMLRNPLRGTGLSNSLTRWFGLDGFQFIENWIKVSTFDAMRAELATRPEVMRLGASYVDDVAAQFARFSSFDYSELPYALEAIKKVGVPFVGFPYFISGRNLGAALNNPGALAMADRIPDAMSGLAGMDEDEKRRFYASLPEWLREQGGAPNFISAPLGKFRKNAAGDDIIGAIPYRQLFPTSIMELGALGESIGTAGVLGPFIEILNALTGESGEAVFSQKYGQRVFEEGSEGWDKAGQVFKFAFESLAPGSFRGTIDLARTIQNNVIPLPESAAKGLYSATEMMSKKPDKEIGDQLFGMFFRSTTPIATDGHLAGWKKEIKRAEAELQRELTPLRKKRKEAYLKGDTEEVQRITEEINRRKTELNQMKLDIRKIAQ
jgi:hypothetical protein